MKSASVNYGFQLLRSLIGIQCAPNLRKLGFSNLINADHAVREINGRQDNDFLCDSLIELIRCFPTLQHIGPVERWSKMFSLSDLFRVLERLEQFQVNVVINFQRLNHFSQNLLHNIQDVDPWRYRYVADKGKIPDPANSQPPLTKSNFPYPDVDDDCDKEDEIDSFEWIWGEDGKLTVYKAIADSTKETRESLDHLDVISEKLDYNEAINGINIANFNHLENELQQDESLPINHKMKKTIHIPAIETSDNADVLTCSNSLDEQRCSLTMPDSASPEVDLPYDDYSNTQHFLSATELDDNNFFDPIVEERAVKSSDIKANFSLDVTQTENNAGGCNINNEDIVSPSPTLRYDVLDTGQPGSNEWIKESGNAQKECETSISNNTRLDNAVYGEYEEYFCDTRKNKVTNETKLISQDGTEDATFSHNHEVESRYKNAELELSSNCNENKIRVHLSDVKPDVLNDDTEYVFDDERMMDDVKTTQTSILGIYGSQTMKEHGVVFQEANSINKIVPHNHIGEQVKENHEISDRMSSTEKSYNKDILVGSESLVKEFSTREEPCPTHDAQLKETMTNDEKHHASNEDYSEEQAWYWDYDENTWMLWDDDWDDDDYEYLDSEEEAFCEELQVKKQQGYVITREDYALGPMEKYIDTVKIDSPNDVNIDRVELSIDIKPSDDMTDNIEDKGGAQDENSFTIKSSDDILDIQPEKFAAGTSTNKQTKMETKKEREHISLETSADTTKEASCKELKQRNSAYLGHKAVDNICAGKQKDVAKPEDTGAQLKMRTKTVGSSHEGGEADDIVSELSVKQQNFAGAHPSGVNKNPSEEIEKENELLITTITTVCMWGHENCKEKSHYKYKWESKQTEYKPELEESVVTTSDAVISTNKEVTAKNNFSDVKKRWELPNETRKEDPKPILSKPSSSATNDKLNGNKNNVKFDMGGVGVAKTLEMLKRQLGQTAKKDANNEKEQRNDELDRMKRLRQAGVTREYLRS